MFNRESILKIGIFSNPQMLIGIAASIVLQCLVIFVVPVQEIFKLTALDTWQYTVAFVTPVIFVILAEIAKYLVAKTYKKL